MATEKKEDFNLVIHHYVHYDPPATDEIQKQYQEIIKILNNLNKKIMSNQKEINEGFDALEAGDAVQLALSKKIDADILKLESAIASGLDGAVILARLNTLKSNSLALTAALEATDAKTPEDSEPPAPAQFTADIDLFVDDNGDLTDVDNGTIAVFEAGKNYDVSSTDPLTLLSGGNPYDVTDWSDSFTAV